MLQSYDVIIIWAGPAGTTTALSLKKKNPDLKVLVIEKEVFPRHRLGEAIIPGIIPTLKKLGCFEAVEKAWFLKKVGSYYFWGKYKDVGIELPLFKLDANNKHSSIGEVFGYHVDRSKYDMCLMEVAQEKWVEYRLETKVVTIDWREDFIDSITLQNGEKLTAQYFVDAWWIQSTFIPQAKKNPVTMGEYFWNICFHGYLKWAKHLNTMKTSSNQVSTTVSAHENYSWSWYIPLSEDIVSVWVVVNSQYNKKYSTYWEKELFITQTISSNPEIKKAIQWAHFIDYTGKGTVMCVKNWNGFSQNTYGGNWFLVGDTAFFSDPILSTWVSMAQKTGYMLWILLSEIISTDDVIWKEKIQSSYGLFLQESYQQVKNVIRFWYEWMSQGFEVKDLFDSWDETLRSFWITNTGNPQFSFWYLVNWLLNSIEDEGEYNNMSYGGTTQEEFENFIKIVTGNDVSIVVKDINDTDSYGIAENFTISPAIKVVDDKVVIGPKLSISNAYGSSFYINSSIHNFLRVIQGKNMTLAQIMKNIELPMEFQESFKKDLQRLYLLGLIKKMDM